MRTKLSENRSNRVYENMPGCRGNTPSWEYLCQIRSMTLFGSQNVRDYLYTKDMVRFEKNKIVIEIETKTPLEDFLSFKSSIRKAIQGVATGDIEPMTLYWLVELLEQEELTIEQLKKVI